MILNIYNIRDERQGTYGTPMITDKDEVQLAHDYESSVEQIQATIERYQELGLDEKAAELLLRSASLKDCVIYKSGTFDNKTGKIVMDEPLLVCRVSDYFREVQHA